ncbi:MAG: abortive infection family protein [Magnetococcales bacterium]|nr:abortive infection family protein [Magnetococcales bacterium]
MVDSGLISKKTRNRFREFLVGWIKHDIKMIFEEAGIQCDTKHQPQYKGERRCLVEQHYHTLDFTNQSDIRKLLNAYQEVIVRSEKIIPSDSNQDKTKSDVQELLTCLKDDGFDYRDGKLVSSLISGNPAMNGIRNLAGTIDSRYLNQQINRMVTSVQEDPDLAIGTAKELVESVCKTILEERGEDPGKDDLLKLVRNTCKSLALLPDDVSNAKKGSETIKKILSSLAQISQGIAELRNYYGTGHGMSAKANRGIQPRHAGLATGAAATLVSFLFETYLERKTKPISNLPEATDGSEPLK